MSSRLFCVKLNIFLEGQGMCPNCCLFSEGMCCDELNEPELNLMETYWGNRFVYGGLGGYCHGGKTGLAAVLHHIPDLEEQSNLIMFGGPHVGIHKEAGIEGKIS